MQNRNISDIIEQYLKSILKSRLQLKLSVRNSSAVWLRSVTNQLCNQNAFYGSKWLFGWKQARRRRIHQDWESWFGRWCGIFEWINRIYRRIDNGNGCFQGGSSSVWESFLNRREANLILSTFNRNVLAFSDHEIEDIVRARILKSVINRLKCADWQY